MTKDWTHLKRVGGRSCLDFINTVDRDRTGFSAEWLTDAIALVEWAEQTQILTPDQAEQLKQKAQQPEPVLFEQAIELRERLYRIFSAISAQQAPLPEDLAHLSGWLKAAYLHSQLTWNGSRVERTQTNLDQLESILWQVARSAEELLFDSMLKRVRECAGTDCGWIFLDTSRNRSRRWCDMEDCGNRAKAQRHYERSKSPHAR